MCALIEYSPLVSEISGKVGGVVFGRGQSGPWVRSWSHGVLALTEEKSEKQTSLTLGVQAWQQLTEAQQTIWNVASLDYPQTSRLGKEFFLSGYQFYMKLFLNNRSISASAPHEDELIKLLNQIDYRDALDVIGKITCDFEENNLGTDYVTVIQATSPQPHGRTASFSSYFKYITHLALDEQERVDITDEYLEVFGLSSVPANMLMFTRARTIEKLTGRAMPWMYQTYDERS